MHALWTEDINGLYRGEGSDESDGSGCVGIDNDKAVLEVCWQC